MQALWQTLHNPDDNIAQVAFRVLGKFGGSNRKMLTTPQQLEYRDTLMEGPSISFSFPDTEGAIDLPVAKASAWEILYMYIIILYVYIYVFVLV